MKIIKTIIPTNLFENLSFCRNQKQESNSQQVGVLVTRNTPSFWLYRVGFYFKSMWNSTDLYKRIFLHLFSDRIVISYSGKNQLFIFQMQHWNIDWYKSLFPKLPILGEIHKHFNLGTLRQLETGFSNLYSALFTFFAQTFGSKTYFCLIFLLKFTEAV